MRRCTCSFFTKEHITKKKLRPYVTPYLTTVCVVMVTVSRLNYVRRASADVKNSQWKGWGRVVKA